MKLGIVLCSLLACIAHGLVVIEPVPGQYYPSPRIPWIAKGWDSVLIAELVPSTSSNKTDRIVLQDIRVTQRGVLQETLAIQSMQEGALAVITATRLPTKYPGNGAFVITGQDISHVTIPAFEMLKTDTLYLLNLTDYGSVVVNLTANDPNFWLKVIGDNGVMVPFSIILGSIGLVCLSLASYKLIKLFTIPGSSSRMLVKTVLVFDIIGNLVRFVYVTIDPFSCRLLFNFLSTQILVTLSIPFTLASTLLISLYWAEVTSKNNVLVLDFLQRFKWVFWGLFIPMIAIELTTSTLRGSGYPFFIWQVVDGAMYICVSIFVTVLFLYGGMKVLNTFKKMPNERSTSTAKTTKRLMMSSIFQIVLILMLIIGGVTPALYINPWSFYFIWFIGFLTLYGISLTQILAFRLPTPEINSSKLSTEDTIHRYSSRRVNVPMSATYSTRTNHTIAKT